jgi:hypothetical protein
MSQGWLARYGGERTVCSVVALALVLLRCAVPAFYEQFNFDSDQAIFGLMAKHMSEFRAFPLFMYGQNYILSVESMVAVPFFWIGGATFMMLRLPLVVMNGIVALWLINTLSRSGGLRPALALVAVVPFVATTTVTSATLVENAGANIELFVYVLALWAARHRPYLLGLILAIGVLNREATIFAVPALLVVALWRRELWTRRFADNALKTASAFAIAWFAVSSFADIFQRNALRSERAATGLFLEVATIAARVSFKPHDWLIRWRSLLADCLPDLLGIRVIHPSAYNVTTGIEAGSSLLAVVLLLLAIVTLSRLAAIAFQDRGTTPSDTIAFAVYLGLIGVQTLLTYPLADNIVPGLPGILRYVLLGLLVPVSLLTLHLALERRRALRAIVVFLVVVWATVNIRDNWRLVREYRVSPPASEHRDLADHLIAQGMTRGWATYWDCYRVDFLARERVILASSDYIRIPSYQTEVERQARTARIVRQPCSVGTRFEAWCIDAR